MVRATLIAGLCCAALPAQACRLALVLAIDVSSSVDEREDRLQRSGLAAALIAPDVVDAFMTNPDPVAIFIFEWSGRYNQRDLVPWTLIETQDDLFTTAETIINSSRAHDDFPTAMGYALGHAAIQLRDVPNCTQHTIDIAGDGANNEGFGPAAAYRAFPFDNVTVNGLVIRSDDALSAPDPVVFYQQHVIRGPGAFIEIAEDFDDYENAMRRKLIREVTPPIVGQLPSDQGSRG
ncbi:von Willebrand factor A [Loktanella sp. S4079]|nr:von Willebrand factor A [Loktanella sp. S4079]